MPALPASGWQCGAETSGHLNVPVIFPGRAGEGGSKSQVTAACLYTEPGTSVWSLLAGGSAHLRGRTPWDQGQLGQGSNWG